MDFKQNHYGSQTFLSQTITFFVRVLFNILMRQKTLTNDFWGLHKNMNCAFPLNASSISELLPTSLALEWKIL